MLYFIASIYFAYLRVCVTLACLLDPLELGLEMTMSHHVGAGTQT